MTTLYTIGHSSHGIDRWLDLLAAHRIETVVDVRSIPYSRFAPWFVRRRLEPALAAAGYRYRFAGRELGGIPDDDELYDEAGHVRYDLVAARPGFAEAIDALIDTAARRRVVLMCGEENPEHCHRRLLVARALIDRDVEVIHLRGDGSRSREETVGGPPPGLFADPLPWRSHRPVRRREER